MKEMHITSINFGSEILESEKTVLLDFWAPWCGPCRMVSPIIDKIAEEMPSVKVGKVNIDDEPELAQKYGVMSIPTLIVMKKGKIVSKSSGAKPKDAILAMLNS